jgi:hypothetical protein
LMALRSARVTNTSKKVGKYSNYKQLRHETLAPPSASTNVDDKGTNMGDGRYYGKILMDVSTFVSSIIDTLCHTRLVNGNKGSVQYTTIGVSTNNNGVTIIDTSELLKQSSVVEAIKTLSDKAGSANPPKKEIV